MLFFVVVSRFDFHKVLGSIVKSLWGVFRMYLGLMFLVFFCEAFLEAKKPMTPPGGVILGPPGRGKGRGKPPPLSKNVAKAKCHFLLLCFLLLCEGHQL